MNKPTPDQPSSTQPPQLATWTALGLAWEFGYLIAGPLVIFALAGRWLDQKMGTSPWLLLGGMALAVGVTTGFLVRKFSRLIQQAEEKGKPS